jgi:hypothetical protein
MVKEHPAEKGMEETPDHGIRETVCPECINGRNFWTTKKPLYGSATDSAPETCNPQFVCETPYRRKKGSQKVGRLTKGIRNPVKTAVEAHKCTRIKGFQLESRIVEDSSRLRVGSLQNLETSIQQKTLDSIRANSTTNFIRRLNNSK